MSITLRFLRCAKRNLLIIMVVVSCISVHHFLMLDAFYTLTDNQTKAIYSNIVKLKLTEPQQQHISAEEGYRDHNALQLLLKQAIQSGEPFHNLLMELSITHDEHLLKISTLGILTIDKIQNEFFISILPKLSNDKLIPINNVLSKWIKIVRKNDNLTQQVRNLSERLIEQDLYGVVAIIDNLPEEQQELLKGWRKRIMNYLYVQEFLKLYFEGRS